VKLRSYTYDRESANYSRDALEELLDSLARDPAITEVNVLAHSMGNWVTLEALRGRSIRATRSAGRQGTDKLKNVMLVAPDVDVDVFRTQIQRMGSARPRMALFVSQDDKALDLSKTIWGGVPRLGEIDPTAEPYRSELERDNILVFDLTSLKAPGDNAHSRAFDDITTVMGMIKQRLSQGQTLGDQRGSSTDRIEASAMTAR
jgi:esterase/lipase superfamily enzyme